MELAGKTITRETFHYWVYYFGLCLLAVSLPSSRFFISVSLQILVYNWIIEGRYREKWRRFTSNRAALAFTLIYFSYLFSLLWSVDVKYALQNDLFHKLPTLFMPLVMSSGPKIDRKKLRLLLAFFMASVFVVTLIGLGIRMARPEASFREASPFMPGIYLGLMLAISVFQLPALVRQVSDRRIHFWLSLLVSTWFIFFLFYLRTLSAIACVSIASVYLFLHFVHHLHRPYLKFLTALAFLTFFILILWPLNKIYKQTHAEIGCDFSRLANNTEYGSTYLHDTTKILRENGNLVYVNIAEDELAEAWKERSGMDFYGEDLKGWELRYTLYRYMASRGLTKDREGLEAMDDRDVEAVEKGITNYLNVDRPGFYIRIYEEFMGLYMYRASGFRDPTWGSFAKRVDLWRASLYAFREKPLFGWGIGSILHATDYGFHAYGSPLEGQNEKPHNQYMYFMLTQGIVGLLLFLALYGYTVVRSGGWSSRMFRIFVIILAIFFLANNPIESQVGQNIFVFFTLFYCFFYPDLEKDRASGSSWW